MLKDLLKVSDADRDKFTKLNNQRWVNKIIKVISE
jgi:hypothetical protein